MTGIVEFLTARLDEEYADAIAAQEADPAPWRANTTNRGSTEQRHGHGSGLVIAGDDTALWDCEGSNTLCMTAPTARHIARHDPARVLREVEAKRRVLARHCAVNVYGSQACDGCGWDREDGHHVEDIEECPELRDMALVYDEHPDYEQAWAVE